jgi:hypothetical protein
MQRISADRSTGGADRRENGESADLAPSLSWRSGSMAFAMPRARIRVVESPYKCLAPCQ